MSNHTLRHVDFPCWSIPPSNSLNGCENNLLNEKLVNEIYMEQLEGFMVLGCKLVMSFYGLKQTPKL